MHHVKLFGLIVILLLAACAEAPTPTPAPTLVAATTATATATASAVAPSATATPVPTATATHTPSPTLTPTPSATPSPTATRTPPPTFPPAGPEPRATYQLQAWTPDDADTLIARLEHYPDTLAPEERGYQDIVYYASYRYAVLALQEALRRFPDVPQAGQWRWQLAYNLARTGRAEAAAVYATLVEEALNAGETDPAGVAGWIHAHEPRLDASVTAVTDPAGYVVQLARGMSGTHLWLVDDPAGARVYPLSRDGDFDFAAGAGVEYGVGDATGDGAGDFVGVHGHQPGSSLAFYYTDVVVYDLMQTPPQPLSFQPPLATHLGWGASDGWSVVADETHGTLFRVRNQVSDRCEAIARVSDYVWNGDFFRLYQTQFDIDQEGAADARFCLPFIFTAAEQGDPAAIATLEMALADLPPPADDGPVADTADEWRVRLGVYHALAGDFAQATATFTDVISMPTGTRSTWLAPAGEFLAAYQSPDDLYRACITLDICDERLALERLVATLPPTAFAAAADRLRGWGVPVDRVGFFDMDGDGRAEQWVLLENGQFQRDVWVLLRGPAGITAHFLETISRDDFTFVIERLTSVYDRPVVRLRTGRDEVLFALEPDPAGGTGVVRLRPQSGNESGNVTPQFLVEMRAALFAGTDPAQIRDTLLAFRATPAFSCPGAGGGDVCPEYTNLLALASELAGDGVAAVDAYLQLWRAAPDGPYTTIARSKLALSLPPTPTVLPSATPTATVTANAALVP